MTADELWESGEHVLAVAIDPLVEFRFNNYPLSHAEIVAAAELRERWEAKARGRHRT